MMKLIRKFAKLSTQPSVSNLKFRWTRYGLLQSNFKIRRNLAKSFGMHRRISEHKSWMLHCMALETKVHLWASQTWTLGIRDWSNEPNRPKARKELLILASSKMHHLVFQNAFLRKRLFRRNLHLWFQKLSRLELLNLANCPFFSLVRWIWVHWRNDQRRPFK